MRTSFCAFAAALCLSCGSRATAPAAAPASQSILDAAGAWFTDRAEETGLRFTHVNGMSGKFYYAEIIGSGAAMFDMDNDGDLDVYLAQGQPLGPGAPITTGGGRLFRNDLVVSADGTRSLRFTDVTAKSGIVSRGYGMGVAAGDFDNDGCVDLYLTNLGANQLFRNNCDGTFTDVSKQSRTDDPSWSVSAAFLDYDRDGWLDLFVGNYLSWRPESSTPCFGPSGRPDYCSPNVYQPVPSRLYHNNHDGTFTDVTTAAGLAGDFGPALGVTTADFNGDGWIDLYVANDGQPNQLWINQHDGTFTNTGLLSGTAMSAHGKAKAGMGVDAGDVDNDGDEDLFVTNLTGEGTDLYVNTGGGLFEEQSARSGLGVTSRAYTGFGAAWFDFDNDGWLDSLVVNGAVQTIEALRRANDPLPLHQRKLLFRNLSNGRFEDVTDRAGAAFQLSEVGRGAAFGDIDNDGDTDVIVNNNDGQARLLVNNVGNKNHWVGLRLVGGGPERVALRTGRDMLGARVQVILDDGRSLWRRARSDASYASANDPRVLVGLGRATHISRVHVVWPDGKTEEWKSVPVDRYTTLREGGS
ncbi:MAG TPA: CRTAC1 family protein [Vicinamibacterales bacterium]|nr:CRTAC1 family protein [Vicinamibacterales bacterium]